MPSTPRLTDDAGRRTTRDDDAERLLDTVEAHQGRPAARGNAGVGGRRLTEMERDTVP